MKYNLLSNFFVLTITFIGLLLLLDNTTACIGGGGQNCCQQSSCASAPRSCSA